MSIVAVKWFKFTPINAPSQKCLAGAVVLRIIFPSALHKCRGFLARAGSDLEAI